MTPERWREIESLLHDALDRPEPEREAFVRARCADDPDLADEVRSLLAVAAASSGFLESPAAGGVQALLADTPGSGGIEADPGELVGAKLGPYVLSRVIASGGMGTVYAARRDDDVYHKTVAVKVVRSLPEELDRGWQAERIARFTLERQVLGELDHPCIARLLDGGTTRDGQPYLVMEHVDGLPIDQYCDRAGLSIAGRVRLFIRVCDAVAEAHRRLILHRDIKPGNILVRADGTPKLLDFGLAKPLDPVHAARANTVDGRFMGTLAYAAPEQVAGTARQDTRSDLYALGLVLYRLVAGRHAYSTAGTMTEVLRRITDEPPPSPCALNPAVSADLGVVILKALSKEPGRRYQSVSEFVADLERTLVGDAVLARAESHWYLLRKTVRRYRGPIATVAALLLLAGAFGVVMAVQAATLARRSGELAAALRQSNIARGRTLVASGSVSAAERVLWAERLAPGGDPGDEAYWALWEAYAQRPCAQTRALPIHLGSRFQRNADGTRLLARGTDGGVVLVDAGSASIVLRFDAEPVGDGTLAFTHDFGRVLVGTGRGMLESFDAATGEKITSLAVFDGVPFTGVAPGPHGGVICSAAGEVALVDENSDDILRRFPVEGPGARRAVPSPDGGTLFVPCADGRILTFDASTGVPGPTFLERWTSTGAVSFTADGRTLIADTRGTEVALIDLATGAMRTLTGPAGWINTVRIERDAAGRDLVLASSFDKSAYAWDLASGKIIGVFPGHPAPVADACLTPDGRRVMTITGAVVREWEFEPGLCTSRLPTPAMALDLLLADGGETLVTGDGEGEHAVRVWDRSPWSMSRVLTGHTGPVSGVALDARSGVVYSASYDGTLRAWDPDGASRVLIPSAGPGHGLNSVALAPDGRTIAVGSESGELRLLSPEGLIVRTESLGIGPERIPSLEFSPDGSWLAVARVAPGEIVLFNLIDGRTRRFPAHSQTIRVVRFNPDRSMIASAGDDLRIRLWSMRNNEIGEPIREMQGHESDIFEIAFSPDGDRIASAGRGGVVKMWCVDTGVCLLTLRPHSEMVFTLAFSPDGRTLYTAGRDGGIVATDLTYYDAHIRGNEAYQRERLNADQPGRR